MDREKQEYYYKKGFKDGFVSGQNQSLEKLIEMQNHIEYLKIHQPKTILKSDYGGVLVLDTSPKKWTENIPENISEKFGEFYRGDIPERISVEYYYPLIYAYRFLCEVKNSESILFELLKFHMNNKLTGVGRG